MLVPTIVVPYYLMPVAALLGLYTLVGIGRSAFILYQHRQLPQRYKRQAAGIVEIESREFATLIVSWIITFLLYVYTVACVDNAMLKADHWSFNPYQLLDLDEDLPFDATVLKQAFKKVSQRVHPDNRVTGNALLFDKVVLAYKTLADAASTGEKDDGSSNTGVLMRNYQLYGHPHGPLPPLPVFSLQVPVWLVFPTGTAASYLVPLYTLILGAVGFGVYTYWQNRREAPVGSGGSSTAGGASGATPGKQEAAGMINTTQSVSVEDLVYMTQKLRPDSTPIDILTIVISTPEQLVWSRQDIEEVEQIRRERLQNNKSAAGQSATSGTKSSSAVKSNASDFDDLLNSDDGWDEGDGEEEDEALAQAKLAEAEREKERARLKQATGQAVELLEGVDDGVLGQQWVEKTLAEAGAWPPKDMGVLKNAKFDWDGEAMDALQHPGMRRMLCIVTGRLYSQMLNSHSELLEAGTKNRIDHTYFKASLVFRQRVGLLLEAALRIGMTLRSYRLVASVIETVAIFKIGCRSDSVTWFNSLMMKQNECLPRLAIQSYSVMAPNQTEIVAGGAAEIHMDVVRVHAEQFLKSKVAMLQKQGIPPEVALQSYREGWWFMIRCKRIDGADERFVLDRDNSAIQALQVDEATFAAFEKETPENRLLSAWPMMVQNIAQKGAKLKVTFKAPDLPGKYRFYVAVRSQDFLGADHELTLEEQIVQGTPTGPSEIVQNDEPLTLS